MSSSGLRPRSDSGLSSFDNHLFDSPSSSSEDEAEPAVVVGISPICTPVRLRDTKSPASKVWTWPRNTLNKDIPKLWECGVFSDVTFVDGTMKHNAHRCILAVRAPGLTALVEDVPFGEEIPVEDLVDDTRMFYAFLYFIYCDELQPVPAGIEVMNAYKALSKIADKFDCSSLKLAAEAELICAVTVENVMELLLFADSHNCALLKESATDFFVANPNKVVKSEGYALVEKSAKILADLIRALINKPLSRTDPNDYDQMNITTLRTN